MKMAKIIKCLVAISLLILAVNTRSLSRQSDNSSNSTLPNSSNNSNPDNITGGKDTYNLELETINTRPANIKEALLPLFPPKTETAVLKKFLEPKYEQPWFVMI